MSLIKTKDGKSFLLPFILITSLFFLWGFAHSILDVLNKHFQDSLSISKTGSALIQAVVYGGYFLMAIPAGKIISRYGYRAGVITGLLLYGIGALLFIPGAQILTFEFFLLCLFGGMLLFDGDETNSSATLSIPYAIIGVIVLIIAFVFSRIKLPEISEEAADGESTPEVSISLWKHKHFIFGLISLFLYVAAQTGLNSFFINFATENAGITPATASLLLGFVCMGLFMLGRMGGSWAMSKLRPEFLLGICAIGATLSMVLLLFASGTIGIGALFLCYLCESIMFPTIFALAIRGVGIHTKQASSYLIMSIVGGAVAPVLMGYIADTTGNMRPAFIIPMLCYIVIATFAFWLKKRHRATN